ncbi:hypothetical protein FRC03_001614 [Tulasnella sp. 419]|nr:hypothetical protein FRC03_001614 [Tulasnella sp. 419]
MNVLQSHLASSPEHRYSCPSCALDFHNQEAVNQHRADVHTVLRTASSSSNSTNDDIPDITWTDEEPTWTFPETLVRLPEINSTRLIQPRTQITLSDLESESEDDFEETRDLGLDPWHLRSGTLNERSYRSLQDSYASHLQRNTRQHTTAPQSNVLSRRREPIAPAPSARIHSFAVALTNQTTQTQRSVGTAPTVTPPSNVASSSIIQEPPPRKCAFPIPCPLCLDLAVDLTSTLCGHVGCKLVSELVHHILASLTRLCLIVFDTKLERKTGMSYL